jgi:hypothetical protein
MLAADAPTLPSLQTMAVGGGGWGTNFSREEMSGCSIGKKPRLMMT